MIKGEESINLFNRIRDRYLEPATGITGLFVISSFIFLVSWGEVNPFLPLFIQNELHANATITNWVMSLCVVLPYLVGLLLAPFWARLADKHGAKPWLLRSGWGSVLVLLLMSIVQNPYELVILKLLQGLFVGFISIANSVLIQLSPRAKIGQTVGLMGTVTSLAMIAAPLIGGFLIPLMSFRLTLVFSAAILLIICIILQRRLPNTKAAPIKHSSGKAPISLPLVLLLITALLVEVTSNATTPYIALVVRQINASTGDFLIGCAVAVTGLFSLLTAKALEIIANRWPAAITLLGATVLGICGFTIAAFVGTVALFIVSQGIVGISNAGVSPSIQNQLTQHTDHEHISQTFSLIQKFQTVGIVIGPFIGALLNIRGGYRMLFSWAAGSYAVVILLIIMHSFAARNGKIKA